jgi:hypothetical protein
MFELEEACSLRLPEPRPRLPRTWGERIVLSTPPASALPRCASADAVWRPTTPLSAALRVVSLRKWLVPRMRSLPISPHQPRPALATPGHLSIREWLAILAGRPAAGCREPSPPPHRGVENCLLFRSHSWIPGREGRRGEDHSTRSANGSDGLRRSSEFVNISTISVLTPGQKACSVGLCNLNRVGKQPIP